MTELGCAVRLGRRETAKVRESGLVGLNTDQNIRPIRASEARSRGKTSCPNSQPIMAPDHGATRDPYAR